MLYQKFLLLSRRKVSYFLLPFLCISVIFIIYQILIFLQISRTQNTRVLRPNLTVLGIHEQEAPFYTKDDFGHFTCIKSLEKIAFSKVNDDYCDCLDGTDEPGTNACPNTKFHCKMMSLKLQYPKAVPSSFVNDGICDCCDGSDEWKKIRIKKLDRKLQQSVKRFLVPCPNLC